MIKKQKPYKRLKEKVKTAKKRKISSTRWLQRQLNDPYVKQSKAEGRRSRAAYKLIQINEKFDLLSLHSLNPKKYPFLLESSSRGNNRNRFSILFYNPRLVLKKTEKIGGKFLEGFDEIWRTKKINQGQLFFKGKKLPFCGGWFVYLGYELVKEIESSLTIPSSPFRLPTAFASRVSTAIIFDHIDQ